jgi:hypothetical protein
MSSVINALKNAPLRSKDGPLFDPVSVGDYELNARYVYAPLTRCRGLGKLDINNILPSGMLAGPYVSVEGRHPTLRKLYTFVFLFCRQHSTAGGDPVLLGTRPQRSADAN